MKKFLAGVVIALFLVTSTGCQKRINTEPPAVVYQRSVLSAADAVDTVSIGLVAVHSATTRLEAAGELDVETGKAIHTWLSNIAKANDKAVLAISLAQVGGQSSDWRAAILNVVAEASKLNPEQLNIKNPNSKATFKIAVATLQSALQAISASFGGN